MWGSYQGGIAVFRSNFYEYFRDTLSSILVAQVIGLLHAVALMFGNEMLFTSWMFSCLLAALLLILPLDSLLKKLSPFLRAVTQVFLFFSLTFLAKLAIGKAFKVHDDAHVFELLKSKFTDFRSFHTLLYTCAVEFDFLGWEMPQEITKTLLLPTSFISILLLLHAFFANLLARFQGLQPSQPVDPAALYNLLQCAAYGVMAVLIMRLKLFLTPHLCLLTSLLAIPSLPISKTTHYSVLVALIAAMSYQGLANIQTQRNIMGEYNNPQLEQLIDWVNAELPPNAVMAGPMPTMANLLLSTGRPIVNHPHYEDSGLRERTKAVYTMFSRRPPSQVHQALQDLRVEYLVLAAPWCLTTERGGCALTEVYCFPITLHSCP